MTRDPQAALREGLDAWNRGDIKSLAAMLDPNVRIHLSGAFPALETDYQGRDGLLAFWREMQEMWDELAMKPGETEEVEGMFLSPITFQGTGRDGIEVERLFWFVWQFDEAGELVTSYSSYRDRDSAVTAIAKARQKGGSPA